ncbi:MAG: ATP-binding protein [Eubacterium sp.]
MKKRLNHTFLIVAAITFLMTVVLFGVVFYQMLCEEVTESLQNNAVILQTAFTTSNDDFSVADKMDFDNLRVTIVRENGTVLYDNFANAKILGNHKDRPEIADALEKGAGNCVRHSDTLAKNTFYYALRRTDGTVLRVGKESNSIYSILLEISPEIIAVVVLIFVISWVLTLLFAKSIIKPIQQMADDMDSIEVESGYKELVPFIQRIKTQHEDIMKSAKMRQVFTANVSHELKTPLTSISGYAELIENGMATDTDVQRFAREIHRNSKRLLTLINDTIRLAELDITEKTIEFEDVNLYELAESCVSMLQINAEKHHVFLSLFGSSAHVFANKGMMEELLYNLCDNAIRYNKEGGSVKVILKNDGDCVRLQVKDTGIGIPQKSKERVFERFYRVDKSRSKQTGGTGLGLAIVKHIVAKHNAKLELESEFGKGTSITVIFPKNTLQE